MTGNNTYRKDIDGLRAIAVLPVVFYHAGSSLFSGGFVGVDVFFVISGYLITSIIAADIRDQQFSIKAFYERRARRLFPALFTVIVFCLVVAPFLLMPEELEDFGQSAATTALFSSNFLFFSEANYFAGPSELKPLLHTWSLAIEEQYYLLFPALLILIRRWLGDYLLATTLTVFVLSLGLSIYTTSASPDAAFYLLPSRAWELMLGSLIALLPVFAMPRLISEAGSLIGLTAILYAVFAFDHDTVFPGLAALLPCLGTALLIVCGQTSGPTVNRVLALGPVVFVGLISYSLYLWHWPIFVFAKHYTLAPFTLAQQALLITASIGLAYLSWRFVEKPFRGPSGILSTRGIFRLSLTTMLVIVLIGLFYDESKGWPGRLPQDVAQMAEVANDKPPERRGCEGIDPEQLTFDRACKFRDDSTPVNFALWGDSHAMAMIPAMKSVAQDLDINGIHVTSNGCGPLVGVFRPQRDPEAECAAFAARVLEIIAAHPEIETIIIAARWARHAEGTTFGEEDAANLYLAEIGSNKADAAHNREVFEQAFSRTMAHLARLNRNILIVESVPEIGFDAPIVLAKARWRNVEQDDSVTLAEFERRQAFVREVFNKHLHAEAVRLDPSAFFCNEHACSALDQAGQLLYFDNNHLSSNGAKRLVAPLTEKISSFYLPK